ncbi:MAG: hypothetical protein ACYDG3_14505 [Bacillati bacterium]
MGCEEVINNILRQLRLDRERWTEFKYAGTDYRTQLVQDDSDSDAASIYLKLLSSNGKVGPILIKICRQMIQE